ncbi:MAG: DUF1641 domain-containing protein [Candidatus Thermoplasmatota archaeon]|jgi:uncharacterized protein YjgD (DUF1641 family)|nr:DUF1641 domain-containing protein [Candidatus Thermoplasmatota archaeon]MCL5955095.1 DUF1641 domain-containing protein [Candidatus Thermoplasmatota archaeon]
MVEKTEGKKKLSSGNDQDDLEPLIEGLIENRDSFEALLNLFGKVKDSGLISALENLSSEFLPSDIEFLSSFMTSRDFLYGFVKTMNVVSALSHSLSSEKASDAIKAILFNSDELWDGMVDGAKNPEATSLLRLYAMLKDPDISAGLTAALYALKAVGSALKKVPEE